MDLSFDNLRYLDRKGFFVLNDFAQRSDFWQNFFYFFSQYGVILIVLGLIYLVLKIRINAIFTAFLSAIIATFISFVIYLLWQRPRPFIAYAESAHKLVGNLTSSSFPSAHTYISFAIAMTVLLYGHKKLGGFMIVIAILVAISRIAAGIHYPSDVIAGAIIGLFSGTLACWWMESFEHFWKENSTT